MGKKREPIKTYILTASFFGQQWQGYVRIPIFQAVKKTISPFLSGFLMSRIEVNRMEVSNPWGVPAVLIFSDFPWNKPSMCWYPPYPSISYGSYGSYGSYRPPSSVDQLRRGGCHRVQRNRATGDPGPRGVVDPWLIEIHRVGWNSSGWVYPKNHRKNNGENGGLMGFNGV